jgi:hypothetical protein
MISMNFVLILGLENFRSTTTEMGLNDLVALKIIKSRNCSCIG